IQIFGRFLCGTIGFNLLDLGSNSVRYARRDLILQIEDILKVAVEAIRPDMSPRAGIYELAGDAHPVSHLAHAALKHIAYPKFATDLPNVDCFSLVREGRVAGDDE